MALATNINQSALDNLQAQELTKPKTHIEWQVLAQKETAQDLTKEQVRIALEMMNAWEKPIIDISKLSNLPHYAELSPNMFDALFNPKKNIVSKPQFSMKGSIKHNDKAKATWILQYLVWSAEVVSSYNALSEEHKKFIQDLANLLLTDDKYVDNIIKQTQLEWDNYIVLAWDYDTFDISGILEDSIKLLRWIEIVEKWIEDKYNYLIEILNDYKNTIPDEKQKIRNQLNTALVRIQSFKWDINDIIDYYKFLEQEWIKTQETSGSEISNIIDAKINKILAEIKEKDDIIKKKVKEKDDIIKKQNKQIKYLEKLKKLSKLAKRMH